MVLAFKPMIDFPNPYNRPRMGTHRGIPHKTIEYIPK